MAFPLTPVIDDFNRQDGPLGGNWVSPTISGDQAPQISSGQAWIINTSAGASAQMSALGGSLTPPIEAYVTLAVAGGAFGVDYLMSSLSSLSEDGYRLQFNAGHLTAYSIIDRVFNQILDVVQAVAVGDSIGVSVDASFLHTVWYMAAGGSWVSVGTVTDSAHPSGSIGIFIDNGSALTRLDNFGGGRTVPPRGAFQ